MEKNDVQGENPSNEVAVEATQEVAPTETEQAEPEKPTESLEARRARLARELKQVEKKLGKEAEPKPKTNKKDSDELDYGRLAFYNSRSDAEKVESEDDIEFLMQTMEDTGKDQDTLLKSNWFKAELKERKEARTVQKATPSSQTSRKSQVETESANIDSWIAKGKLPDDFELRAKVVARKYELAREGRLK